MMRARIWLPSLLILVACALLFLVKPRKQEQPSPQELPVPGARQSAPSVQQKGEERSRNVLPDAAISPTPPSQVATPADSNAIHTQMLATWQAPIDFYGKVVDETSNALAGAQVVFQWVETPDEDGNKTATTESDASGLFSLHGARGPDLVVSVAKQGYYSSREQGHPPFKYGAFAIGGFSPDPRNPVVFHLRKKGTPEPLVRVRGGGLRAMKDFPLVMDGKPTGVSLRDGTMVPSGQADLEVTSEAGVPLGNTPSRTSWRCSVKIPGGGLIPTDEEFPFLAPESGYKEADEREIGSTNWTERLNCLYYVKTRDGNFGRLKLRIVGVPGKSYFRMESFLNPSGSRNLEPPE